VPLVVLAFFALPLAFTLFFGRTFCGAVCPIWAIQDVVLLRPVRVPGWLAGPLQARVNGRATALTLDARHWPGIERRWRRSTCCGWPWCKQGRT
jgi:polyferredoxin